MFITPHLRDTCNTILDSCPVLLPDRPSNRRRWTYAFDRILRSLTEDTAMERGYSQTLKETLFGFWVVQCIHKYLSGPNFAIGTNNQVPSVSIQRKRIRGLIHFAVIQKLGSAFGMA